MKKVVLLCMVSVLLVFTACSAKLGKGDAQCKETANDFFHAVFAVSEDDVSDFLEMSSEEDLQQWMSDKYGDYLTENGLENAMRNRIVSLGIELKREDKDFESPKITIEKRKDSGDENWYNYEVSLQTGDEEVGYSGSMLFVQQDDEWLIDKMTRN